MNIIVIGCNGRMGAECVREVAANNHLQVSGGTVRNQKFVDADIGELAGLPKLNIKATLLKDTDFNSANAVIDFSQPDGLVELLDYAVQHKLSLVTGTTGLKPNHQQKVDEAAKIIPIVQSFNMSLGVNVLANLIEKAANALGDEFDIEINEMHHRHKKDAPSGTALLLGEAAAKGRNVALAKVQSPIDRNGERKIGDIGFSVMRGGGVIGDHTVMLAGESERIELIHRGHDRSIYAKGAVKAAKWLQDKPAGLYDMQDVLELKNNLTHNRY